MVVYARHNSDQATPLTLIYSLLLYLYPRLFIDPWAEWGCPRYGTSLPTGRQSCRFAAWEERAECTASSGTWTSIIMSPIFIMYLEIVRESKERLVDIVIQIKNFSSSCGFLSFLIIKLQEAKRKHQTADNLVLDLEFKVHDLETTNDKQACQLEVRSYTF